MTQQQMFISHACSRLGLWSLSSQWLRNALDNMNESGLSDSKEAAQVVLCIISAIKGNRSHQKSRHGPCSVDVFSLYQDGGLAAFFLGFSDKPRLFVHLTLAALQQGLRISAMAMFQKTTDIFNSPTPPAYYEQLSQAINAQIIIHVDEGDMNEAVNEMHRRLNVVSKWKGSTSGELAHELHRFGCLHSALGHHKQCNKYLEEALHIGNCDRLDCIKLLATSYDAMHETDSAIHQYERALLITEDDFDSKARLTNALSHLHIKVGGQRPGGVDHLEKTINYLEKSLQIQQNEADAEGKENSNTLLETMILLGNAMSATKYFSEAVDCYELALSSMVRSGNAMSETK